MIIEHLASQLNEVATVRNSDDDFFKTSLKQMSQIIIRGGAKTIGDIDFLGVVNIEAKHRAVQHAAMNSSGRVTRVKKALVESRQLSNAEGDYFV
jgi:hypothetical protein